MKKIDKSYFHVITKLLKEGFSEDQLVLRQIRGIENSDDFLEKLLLSQMFVLNNAYEIHSLDENYHSVLVGYEKKNYSMLREIILSVICQSKLSGCVNANDLKIFAQNSKEIRNLVDLNWHREYVKGNYYYIKIIAVAKEHRGKGDFRKLITPIITRCNEKAIPIILETNTPENVPIYQHVGFELVKTIPDEKSDFCQYCFIKKPE